MRRTRAGRCGGVLGTEALQGQGPGGVQPSLVAERLPAGEQLCPAAPKPLEILLRGHSRLLQVGGGLSGRQGEIADLRSELVGDVGGNAGHSSAQESHGFGPVQDVNLEAAAQRTPARRPRGDQDVAGSGRQIPGVIARVVRVVEYEEPTVPAGELGQHSDDGLGCGSGRLETAPGSQGDEILGDQRGFVRIDPPHEVVVRGVSVRVLDDQLGLAGTAEAARACTTNDPWVSRARRCSSARAWSRPVKCGLLRDIPNTRPYGKDVRGGDRVCGRKIEVQAAVLRQHRGFETAKGRARVDSQLVREGLSRSLERLQRLDLTP